MNASINENLNVVPSRKRRKHSVTSRKPLERVDANIVSPSSHNKRSQPNQSAGSAKYVEPSSIVSNKDRAALLSSKHVIPSPHHTGSVTNTSQVSSPKRSRIDAEGQPRESQRHKFTVFPEGQEKSSLVPTKRSRSHLSSLSVPLSNWNDTIELERPTLTPQTDKGGSTILSPAITLSSPPIDLHKRSESRLRDPTIDLESTFAALSPPPGDNSHLSLPLLMDSPERPPVLPDSPVNTLPVFQPTTNQASQVRDISIPRHNKDLRYDSESHMFQSQRAMPPGDELVAVSDQLVAQRHDAVIRRPTNMATSDEDVILPVNSPPKHKKTAILSAKPLWRPTNLASPDEDVIMPISPSLLRRKIPSTGSEPVQLDKPSDKFAPRSSDKIKPRASQSPLQSRRIETTRKELFTHGVKGHMKAPELDGSEKELSHSSATEAVQSGPSPVSEIFIGNKVGQLEPAKIVEDSIIPLSVVDHSTEQGRQTRRLLPAQLRMGVADTKSVSSRKANHEETLRGKDGKDQFRRRDWKTRSPVEPDIQENDDTDYEEGSDADMEAAPSALAGWGKESPLRASHISLSSESSPDLRHSGLATISEAPTPHAANQKPAYLHPRRQHVVTYSKRRHDVQEKVTLPSMRALGIRSQSPTIAEISQQTSDNDANESSHAEDGEKCDNKSVDEAMDDDVGNRRGPKQSDFLQAFYLAQRQLWKEVDEISLEEGLD